MQALENADRLDPNDPVVAIARTAIALDAYQADEAIRAARETVRRSRLRGGDYAGLAVNRQAGSYPAQAYRFLNLDEWARFYGDRVFDPFTAIELFRSGRSASRTACSSMRPTIARRGRQRARSHRLHVDGPGPVLRPAGRFEPRRPTGPGAPPVRRYEIGGSLVNRNGRAGWGADATVQGFTNEPAAHVILASPPAASAPMDASRSTTKAPPTLRCSSAWRRTPADRFLVFGTASNAGTRDWRASTRQRVFQGRAGFHRHAGRRRAGAIPSRTGTS